MSERKENETIDSYRIQERDTSQNRRQIILDESRVIDRNGLGGRQVLTTQQGSIERRIFLPLCHVCGRLVSNVDLIVCPACGRVTCPSCSVSFNNSIVCSSCARNILPSKDWYKVVCCVANRISKVKAISELTHIVKENVEDILVELSNRRLIVKRGIFFFSRYEITDLGLESISLGKQIYGDDFDIHLLDAELRRYILKGRNKHGLIKL